jgi:hypothetical protein
MATYTFHPCKPDGSSATFATLDLASEAQVSSVALEMLGAHQSCAYVAVWDGDRPVMVRHRAPPGRDALTGS